MRIQVSNATRVILLLLLGSFGALVAQDADIDPPPPEPVPEMDPRGIVSVIALAAGAMYLLHGRVNRSRATAAASAEQPDARGDRAAEAEASSRPSQPTVSKSSHRAQEPRAERVRSAEED